MNKFLCAFTGGHKYRDSLLVSKYYPATGKASMENRCIKCGTPYLAEIPLDDIVRRDIERKVERIRWNGR